MQQLQPQQQYVTDIADQLGYGIKLVYHPHSTDTCQQKLSLLQQRFPEQIWSLDRVVKTIFADVDDKLVGFVLPEKGQRVTEDLVESAYQQAGISGDYFRPDVSRWYIPPGMEVGTCTPFVPEDGMKFVDYIFIQQEDKLDSLDVDISIGGIDKEAHKISMHLPYGAIFDILKERFDGKIHKFE
tara:strand:- start:42 stop:593 length:552 start_codon:yes stop_codon:yes gene_type:complete